MSGEMGGVGESEGTLWREGDDEDELVDMAAAGSDFQSYTSPRSGAVAP